jgi:hypothetical protein
LVRVYDLVGGEIDQGQILAMVIQDDRLVGRGIERNGDRFPMLSLLLYLLLLYLLLYLLLLYMLLLNMLLF